MITAARSTEHTAKVAADARTAKIQPHVSGHQNDQPSPMGLGETGADHAWLRGGGGGTFPVAVFLPLKVRTDA